MLYPARHTSGNVIWTLGGEEWAMWSVDPTTYARLSRRGKLGLYSRTRGVLMGLESPAMVLSVCEPMGSADVVDKMVDGVELGRHPAWGDAASATLDTLEGSWLWRRLHFLVVRLSSARQAGMRGMASTARASVGQMFRAPPPPPRAVEVKARAAQADMLGERLGQFLRLRPAGSEEIYWLYARAARRGVDDFPLSAVGDKWRRGEDLRWSVLRGLEEATFFEGGDKTDADRPRHRRYLRVETEAGVSFQSFLAVADMPHRFVFPDGAEFLWRADETSFPVDWCARIEPVANAEAQAKTRRQARQLLGQVGEWDAEEAGPPQALAEAIDAIDDERAALASNPSDPELEVSVVFSVWGSSLRALEGRAELLRSAYEVNEFSLPRPTGGQRELFAAMLPGAALPPVCRHFTQFLLPRDLSAAMPFAGCELGDPGGMLLGLSLDGGASRPVFMDPARGPAIDRSGSIGIFGELGKGKSYLAKLLIWATVARGGRVVTLDRTSAAEYVQASKVIPGRSQVVRLASDANLCLDPLRVFAGDDRERYTTGFLNLLCRVEPAGLESIAIAEAVQAVAARGGALADVMGHLETQGNHDPAARDVARKLRAFSRAPLARLAFGGGQVLELDADFIVFHTPGLSLPDKEMLENEHLARYLLPEQIFSQALLYLVAAAARSVILQDRRRFAAALFDESWATISSMEGRQVLLETARDGRKHNGGLWIASQHPGDVGDDRLVGLLRNRFVFHQSRDSAKQCLAYMDMDPSEDAVELIAGEGDRSLGQGQCLYRDLGDRMGVLQVLPAPLARLREAFNTRPVDDHHSHGDRAELQDRQLTPLSAVG